jgi:tetratricopeptide (TPR) repeat protein
VLTGELDAALSSSQRALALAPDPYSKWFLHLLVARNYTFVAQVRGDPELVRSGPGAASIAVLEASLSLSAAPEMQGWVGMATLSLAEAYLAQADAERARSTAQSSLQPLQRRGEAPGVGVALKVLGQAELALGNSGRAAAYLDQALAQFETLGARIDATFAMVARAEAAAAHKELPVATHYFQRAQLRCAALELPWCASHIARIAAGT